MIHYHVINLSVAGFEVRMGVLITVEELQLNDIFLFLT